METRQSLIPIVLTFDCLNATNFMNEVYFYEKMGVLSESVKAISSSVTHLEFYGECHGRVYR